MPVSKLQPGEPLTYDFINQMVDNIINLETQLNNDKKSIDQKQIIKVMGSFNNKSFNGSNTLIKIGEFNISKKELKSKLKFEIPFFPRTGSDNESSGGTAFSSPPIVMACLGDDKDEKDLPFANIVVSNITKTKFTIKMNLISKLDDDTLIKINFIAIGPYGNSNKS